MIVFEGVLVGSYMDGVYFISIDLSCDFMGCVMKDWVLYVGDFWIEVQLFLQLVKDCIFIDKVWFYVQFVIVLFVIVCVFDVEGYFIKEVEDWICLNQ